MVSAIPKDGFFMADCVKDFMFTHGDKFGDNKHEYTLGDVANVSIVHYAAHVAKEDQQAMTQKICFERVLLEPRQAEQGNGQGNEQGQQGQPEQQEQPAATDE